ncbi:unnamed protein product, partial [Amoebophrya sp. A120]
RGPGARTLPAPEYRRPRLRDLHHSGRCGQVGVVTERQTSTKALLPSPCDARPGGDEEGADKRPAGGGGQAFGADAAGSGDRADAGRPG